MNKKQQFIMNQKWDRIGAHLYRSYLKSLKDRQSVNSEKVMENYLKVKKLMGK